MIFRDEHERKAHDVICFIKYGSVGGQVRMEDVRRVADILRGHRLDPPKPRVAIPTATAPKITIKVEGPKINVSIPKPTINITPP